MAQFDVHRNAGRHKDAIPFVFIVQSSQFNDFRRRLVVPLVRTDAIGPVRFRSFNPAFKIKGVKVRSLAGSGQDVIGALDDLFSRAWQ